MKSGVNKQGWHLAPRDAILCQPRLVAQIYVVLRAVLMA